MIIAVDFDGTISEHEFPHIGPALPGAWETLKWLQSEGHELVLNTCREGTYLQAAIDFCKRHGVEFVSHNVNSREQIGDFDQPPRKVFANIYIDDRNLGGFPGWATVKEVLDKSATFKGI